MGIRRQTVTRHVLGGKRVPAGTPGAEKVRRKTKKWYGSLPAPGGGTRRVPLSTNKSVAQRMYGELLAKAERQRTGTYEPAADWRHTPVGDHIDAFLAAVAAGKKGRRPPSARQVATLGHRLRSVCDACGFAVAADIAAEPVEARLAALAAGSPVEVPGQDLFAMKEVCALLGVAPATVSDRCRRQGLPRVRAGGATRYPRATVLALAECRRGLGRKTASEYAAVLRRFTRWLVARGRLARDPLAELQAAGPGRPDRRQRRPLAAADVPLLLETAAASARTFMGLSGRDRWALYLTALSTGFRAEELSHLTPARFLLDAEPPVVLLGRSESKNDEGALQPLPLAVVPALRGHLAGRPADAPLWPGPWAAGRGAEMLRRDLAEAGIPYRVEGPDGALFADFHALRHTFGAALKRAGVTLSAAMRLMRHSDPKLTAAVYGREDLAELGAAADRIGGALAGGKGEKAAEKVTRKVTR